MSDVEFIAYLSSYFSYSIKYSIETYCPLILMFILQVHYSLLSPFHHSTILPELLRAHRLPPASTTHGSHACNTSKEHPPPPWIWLHLLHIEYYLYFIKLVRSWTLLTWYILFCDSFHSVLISITVQQLLFYICFCLCLDYFLFFFN